MSNRKIVCWIALCAIAPVAGVGAAVALGAPQPPPPTSSNPPPTSTSTPPPTSTSTPPTSSTPPATTTKPPHSTTTPPKTHTHTSSTPTTPVTTPVIIPTTPVAAIDPVKSRGSTVPHFALVASIVAGGVTVFGALVLAAVLAVARSRRGGPRGPEGGHIIIR
jgi:cytoskeletal protein RodZ